MSEPYISSLYLTEVFADPQLILDRTIAALKDIEFDAIAIRGYSGALIGSTVAYLMKKDLILVRKKEPCHSYNKVEGRLGRGLKYVIVDDFCCSGDTLNAITDAIEPFGPACVGVYLYLDLKRTFGYHDNGFKEYMRLKRIFGPQDELENTPECYRREKAQNEMIAKTIAFQEQSKRPHSVASVGSGCEPPLGIFEKAM